MNRIIGRMIVAYDVYQDGLLEVKSHRYTKFPKKIPVNPGEMLDDLWLDDILTFDYFLSELHRHQIFNKHSNTFLCQAVGLNAIHYFLTFYHIIKDVDLKRFYQALTNSFNIHHTLRAIQISETKLKNKALRDKRERFLSNLKDIFSSTIKDYTTKNL